MKLWQGRACRFTRLKTQYRHTWQEAVRQSLLDPARTRSTNSELHEDIERAKANQRSLHPSFNIESESHHDVDLSIGLPLTIEDMARNRLEISAHKQHMTALQQMLGLIPHTHDDTKDVVFISVDCEAYEHDQSQVTEIGMSVLDIRDIVGIEQDAWLSKMKHAHFRPIEYRNLVNRQYVRGCPDRFAFGTSTWVNLDDAAQVLKRIFQDPASLQRAADLKHTISTEKRKIVLVGHALSNEIKYLQKLGFALPWLHTDVRRVDTQVLAGSTKKVTVGLQRLLQSLGIQPTHLHNAGNDATYTLQALILMAIKEHHQPGSVATGLTSVAPKLPPPPRNMTTELLETKIVAKVKRPLPEDDVTQAAARVKRTKEETHLAE